jgi:protein-arginine kinase activator protein McsA
MNQYFESLLIEYNMENDSIEELTIKMNEKLDKLIKEEAYEEAIRVRDYMNSKNIKRL